MSKIVPCRVLGILLSLVFALHSTSARASTECEALLESSLKTLFSSKISVLKVNAAEAGLPARHVDRERNEEDGVVRMDSDFGPTLWTSMELIDWLSLDRFLHDPLLAAGEMKQIAVSREYCTLGIRPLFCEVIRNTRNSVPDESGLVEHFPWDPTPFEAAEMFKTLVRETLVSHTLFTDLEGNLVTGESLPLNTRVVVATAPMIAPLMPFLQRYPLTLPPSFELGGIMDELNLLAFKLRSTTSGGDLPLFVNLITPPPAMGVGLVAQFAIHRRDDGLLEEIQTELNARLKDFRVFAGIKAAAHLTAEWDQDDNLELKIKGMNQLSQILFYYYLANVDARGHASE